MWLKVGSKLLGRVVCRTLVNRVCALGDVVGLQALNWVSTVPGGMTMEAVDWVALKENCADDDSLVNEVLELFRTEADTLVNDVGVAVSAGDAIAVKRSAHRLKGALVSLAAKPSTELARQLEQCGSEGNLGPTPELFIKLKEEIVRLLAVLAVPRAA